MAQQLKNNTGREWTIKGVKGAIAPGEARNVGTADGEVPPDIAQEYSSCPGWELIDERADRKKIKSA